MNIVLQDDVLKQVPLKQLRYGECFIFQNNNGYKNVFMVVKPVFAEANFVYVVDFRTSYIEYIDENVKVIVVEIDPVINAKIKK